jgi:hypothetical protein
LKQFISEFFIGIAVLAIIAAGLGFGKSAVMTAVDEIESMLEERKVNKGVAAKLAAKSGSDLRRTAVDVLLWDDRAKLDWLENKSILDDEQRARQIEDCRTETYQRGELLLADLSGMTDEQIVKMITSELEDRPLSRRRQILEALGKEDHEKIPV